MAIDKLLELLEGTYGKPKLPEGASRESIKNTWFELLKNYTEEQLLNAGKQFIFADKYRKFPTIGQIGVILKENHEPAKKYTTPRLGGTPCLDWYYNEFLGTLENRSIYFEHCLTHVRENALKTILKAARIDFIGYDKIMNFMDSLNLAWNNGYLPGRMLPMIEQIKAERKSNFQGKTLVKHDLPEHLKFD